MNTLKLLEKAISIATKAHSGKSDRYGAPYILHPLRVMNRVQDEKAKIVAILHDVVEDTDWTFKDLRKADFSAEIIKALDCLTKREGEPYEQLVKRSANNRLAVRVKIADLEDNMDIRRMPEMNQDAWDRLRKYHRAWKYLTTKNRK